LSQTEKVFYLILVDGLDDFGSVSEDGKSLTIGRDFRIDSDRNDRDLRNARVQLPHRAGHIAS
jgi:hypothetical protein